MPDKVQRDGACLCGAVRVIAPEASNNFDACHCNMCRRWTGGPLLAVECGSDVRFAGESNIAVYASSDWAERGFCKHCGSHLFYRLKPTGQYAIPAGLFDDAEDLTFHLQIFIDEKPPFYEFANRTKNMTGAEVFAQFGASPE